MVAATTLTYPPISAQCHASGRPAGWFAISVPTVAMPEGEEAQAVAFYKGGGACTGQPHARRYGSAPGRDPRARFRIVAGGEETVTGGLVPEAPAPRHSSVPSSATLRPESQAHSSLPAFRDAPHRARRNEAPTSSDRYTSLCLDTSDADPRLSQGEWAGAR